MNLRDRVLDFVVDLAPLPAVPVAGTRKTFPVRRLYCIGRNYAEHAREMGHDPKHEKPFFFQKAPDSVVTDGVFPYPPASADVQHEIELVVALKAGGHNVPAAKAKDLIYGYAVGLDMTRRDLQAEAKKQGRPWETAKAFDRAAPIGAITPVEQTGLLLKGPITLDVNGERRQSGDLADMIWPVADVIAELSQFFMLAPGDLIFTGTPSGVGAIKRGDKLHGEIVKLAPLDVTVT
ncbi:fumarylacetoacetate hydrolase family protein [Aestuariivirga sp. YIM B02566]|uniref:Fumarylacetoacetate hydrolase family protein n=1 Tax=Taklimakanibacter albus TaxID=2800327 RepID=A0ACC5RFQ9_9HYPH|nr:fumarylacetoacetate hydrolase family protein [Aestuariivirga sp. YIM B02566]MBK1871442.1 fumarylacetoacetate hydrolase family protein [Aestuariivirga sp. YIM B02566]